MHRQFFFRPFPLVTTLVTTLVAGLGLLPSPGLAETPPDTRSSQTPRRLAFVIDNTASMSDELAAVQTTVREQVESLDSAGQSLEYHLLTYKDHVRYRGKTTDPKLLATWVDRLSAGGGGECPEEMLEALVRIAGEAPQSDAWVTTDAGFHGGPAKLARTVFILRRQGVRVHPLLYDGCFARDLDQDGNPLAPAPGEAIPDPEAFAFLAEETGGHHFRISAGETAAAADVVFSEMLATADLRTVTGTVTAFPRGLGVHVDAAAEKVNFLLASFDGAAVLTLRDPAGNTVTGGDPGVTHTVIRGAEYYQIALPAPGLWQAELAGHGTFVLSTSATSQLTFEALAGTPLPVLEETTLRGVLTGPAVTSPTFSLIPVDGGAPLTVHLFDDGEHGDGAAGDGLYAGPFKAPSAGAFRLRVAGTLDGLAFEREAPEVIRIQPLKVGTSRPKVVIAGTTSSHRFRIRNLGATTETYRLKAWSDRGWADLSGLPATVSLPPGGKWVIDVPVHVAAGAAEGEVEEILLVAVAGGDPRSSYVAPAVTRASRRHDVLTAP